MNPQFTCNAQKLDLLRISEKNKCRDNIKEIQTIIKRLGRKLEKLQLESPDTEKVIENIQEKKQNIQELEQKIMDISSKKYDSILEEDFKKSSDLSSNIQSIKKQDLDDKRVKKAENREVISTFYTRERALNREIRSYQYEYKNYLRKCSRIPDFIHKNIKGMPENKGYIWNDITIYGQKPQQGSDRILFEPQKGFLIIHEWKGNTYSKYKQKGKKNPRECFFKQNLS
jgi:hypothetical protein